MGKKNIGGAVLDDLKALPKKILKPYYKNGKLNANKIAIDGIPFVIIFYVINKYVQAVVSVDGGDMLDKCVKAFSLIFQVKPYFAPSFKLTPLICGIGAGVAFKLFMNSRKKNAKGQIEVETAKEAETDRFIALVKKYKDCTELTDTMLYAFIDRIEVHEATGGRTIYRQQLLDIHFNFIGNYYPPCETVSEEERIAAIDAERQSRKKAKGQRSAENRKKKIDELRMAAEAGDPVAVAQYEEYLTNLRERNKKYRQKLQEAKKADPEYVRQMDEKERAKQEKMLETERKRMERANKKAKLTRAELKEKAKTDPEAAKEWAALKAKEAEARQRKKEREEERMASDPEYAAMMAERKAEYNRRHTAQRKAEREALVEQAKTDPEAAQKLADIRKYQSEATVKSYQKMRAEAEAGNPEAIERYEAHLAKRRDEYHQRKNKQKDIPA